MNEKLSWLDRLLIRLALAKAIARGPVPPSNYVKDIRKAFLEVRKAG